MLRFLMASIMDISKALLGGNPNEDEVHAFAKKITDYCGKNGPKAERISRILRVFIEEVVPIREELGEEGYDEVAEVAREEIMRAGGVTGFLSSVEGGKRKD